MVVINYQEQLQAGTFEHTIHFLIENKLDLSIFYPNYKNDDAAVMSAGYSGLALGATPTAIANMTAVSQRYGASHQAFLVIPLVGAFL